MTMTNQTDGGGGSGGGGTPLSICAISPADTESTLWNFLKRIEELEKAVSQMLGGNVSAGQLSDISQQVGWVYGVTYMGVPGWTQTEYGTLIPPTGFSLSSVGFPMYNACTGEYEAYQGVSVDSDGVLQFGFTASGGVCGASVESWNDAALNAGAVDYASVAWSIGGGANQSISRNITITTNSRVGEQVTVKFTVSRAGIYFVSANVYHNSTGYSLDASWNAVSLGKNTTYQFGANQSMWGVTGSTVSANSATSGILSLNAGDTVDMQSNSSVTGSPVLMQYACSAVRLSS